MFYTLKDMDGNHFKITEDEYAQVLDGDGLLVFPSLGITINKSRIASIYPESMADEIETRREQQVGYLHDGTKVKRHFGQWVDAEAMAPDDRGNYKPVEIDRNYYREIAIDFVFTLAEYEKIKHLPMDTRRKVIADASEIVGRHEQFAVLQKLIEMGEGNKNLLSE